MGGDTGKEQWKKEAVSHQSKGGSRALTQVSKEKLYMGVVGVRGHLFRENQPGTSTAPSPNIAQRQKVFVSLFISTAQVLESQTCFFISIPLTILEQRAIAQPVSQVETLRPRDAK